MMRCGTVMRRLQLPFQRAYTTGANSTSGTGKDAEKVEDLHPIRRTFRLLGNDMRKIKEFFVPHEQQYGNDLELTKKPSKFTFSSTKEQTTDGFQTHCDVLVIGGGGMGSSIAYWLKEKAREGLNVVVVEKDETYMKSGVNVSTGGLCPQFSLPENIEMSLFGAEFMRNASENFGNDIPLDYTPHGHLVLSDEANAEALRKASQLQNELGARNEVLTAERLAVRFPWLNTSGIALGCLGLEREGWFDSWALLANYRRAASGYGAHFVKGEVVDFEYKNQSDIIVTGDPDAIEGSYQSLDKAVVHISDGTKRTIKFALCVIAAGTESGNVARLAQIGRGIGMLRVPLPIDGRKRCTYVLHTEEPTAPGIAMPMLVDASGTFVRRDGLGGHYVCGFNADSETELSAEELAEHFESTIRPILSNRVPALDNASLVKSSSGSYNCNVYDENGIVGAHPYYHNLYIATGFGGQGMQQTPAVGRAISELIMDGQFRTLDLSRLSFDRLIVDKPMYEFSALN